MKKIFLLTSIVMIAFLAACQKHVITGGGNVIAEMRTVPAFHSVQTHGDVDAFVTYGTTQSVEVTGYENLVPIFETKVINGTLVLEFNAQYHNVRRNNIKVNITVPAISGANINGSGDIRISNMPHFTNLVLGINGSGSIIVTGGQADKVVMNVNGSGDIKASQATITHAEANIQGSGDIWIAVTGSLKARINGSGDIRYWGNPTLDVIVQGSGKVIKQ